MIWQGRRINACPVIHGFCLDGRYIHTKGSSFTTGYHSVTGSNSVIAMRQQSRITWQGHRTWPKSVPVSFKTTDQRSSFESEIRFHKLGSYFASRALSTLFSALYFSISALYLSFSRSRNAARMAIWFSLMRRASRDLLAATLFLRRRAQYLSSFASSGTNTWSYVSDNNCVSLWMFVRIWGG